MRRPPAGVATARRPATSTCPACAAIPENVLLRSLRELAGYGLDVVAANHEFASGQFEINLWHSDALDAADRAYRFKGAVKELARREGKLATFMAKPYNDEGGSGFHLHFSTLDDAGSPLFDDPDGKDGLSTTAHAAIAGVLAHAPALAALSNPTINSYKRFGPDTLAPWLIDWGLDNRSAMVRVPPERGGASRLELRLGDATANPYLAIAGLLARPTWAFATGWSRPPPWRATATTPARPRCCRRASAESLDALEADTELRRSARPAVRADLRDLQARRDRSLQQVRHRLGVQRVRVPPLTPIPFARHRPPKESP